MFHTYLLPPVIRVVMEFAGYCKIFGTHLPNFLMSHPRKHHPSYAPPERSPYLTFSLGYYYYVECNYKTSYTKRLTKTAVNSSDACDVLSDYRST